MPYVNVNVHVDASDVLHDLSDGALKAELARRQNRAPVVEAEDDSWEATELANDLRNAFYVRDASRFEALLMALDRGDVAQPRRLTLRGTAFQ